MRRTVGWAGFRGSRSRSNRYRRLLGGWLAVCTLVWGCAPASDSQNPPQATPPSPVTVAKVQLREVTVKQTCVGTVAPVRISTVGSPMEGRVVEFLVREGDYVRKRKGSSEDEGQQTPPQIGEEIVPLARLRTESLEIQLAAAQAELEVREAELRELELSEPLEIEQAKARKDAAESLMEFARSRLERTRELRGRAVSEDELEELGSIAEAADKAFREKQAALKLAQSGIWEKKIEQAKARVTAQRETINQLQDDLEQHEIYAPFDGYVTKELTEVGQWVGKGDPIAEVVEIDSVYVEIPVLEDYVSPLEQRSFVCRLEESFESDSGQGVLPNLFRQELAKHDVRLSQNATITAEAEGSRWRISDQDRSYTVTKTEAPSVYEVYTPGTEAEVEIGALPGQTLRGEVVAIVPQADLRSRTFPVKVLLENPPNPADPRDLLLKPGMFARVTLPVGKRTMLLVPKDALVPGETSPTVWVAASQAGGTAIGPATVEEVEVNVDLQKSDNRWIEILGPLDQNGSLPLKDGQLVIVEGNERIPTKREGGDSERTGMEPVRVDVVRIVDPDAHAQQ